MSKTPAEAKAIRLRGGAEFAGHENGGPKKNKDWKMQDLENDGPGYTSKLANLLCRSPIDQVMRVFA